MNHFQLGLYRLFKSSESKVDAQAFFCDARGHMNSVGGIAFKRANNTAIWKRHPKSGPAYGNHIKANECIHGNCEESALQLTIDGESLAFEDLGPYSLNTVLPEQELSADGFGYKPFAGAWHNEAFYAQQMSLPSGHDRESAVAPTCLGDSFGDVVIKTHVPKLGHVYEPVVTIEVGANLQLDSGGLCNVPPEVKGTDLTDSTEPALQISDSIFSREDLFELCGVCGMLEAEEVSGEYTQHKTNSADLDGWSGCNPAHSNALQSISDVCKEQQDLKVPEDDTFFSPGDFEFWGKKRCNRFATGSNWHEDCVMEFCLCQMPDIADMIDDIKIEEQQEQTEHSSAGLEGLVGKVWRWDTIPDGWGKFGNCDLVAHPLDFNQPDEAGQFVDNSINYASTSNSLALHWQGKMQASSSDEWDWKDNFVVKWNGTLHAPRTGIYQFRLVGDDAAMLYLTKAGDVSASVTIENNGLHGMRAIDSAPTQLEVGEYIIEVESCEKDRGWGIQLMWQLPSVDDQNTFQAQNLGRFEDMGALTHSM